MRRKRVDSSEDDLDKSMRSSASDRTPPPSIPIPRKSLTKSPKKARISSPVKKKTPNLNPANKTKGPNKIKGFLGAIELTSSESEDDKPSKVQKTPQTKKKRPPDSEVINLCSDEEPVSKSPSKGKHGSAIEHDASIVLSSGDQGKVPSSSKVLLPQKTTSDNVDCSLDAIEGQSSPLNTSQTTQDDRTSKSTTSSSSPFSAPVTNIPPRVIVFSDGKPPPTLQTSLYFSRTLASVETSLSRRQKVLKRTNADNAPKSHIKTAHSDAQLSPSAPSLPTPPSLPPQQDLSPSTQSKTRHNLKNLPTSSETPMQQSREASIIPPTNTLLDRVQATIPLFLPSSSSEDDELLGPSPEAVETRDPTPPLRFTSTSEDIISRPLLEPSEDDPSAIVTSTINTVDKTNDRIATPPSSRTPNDSTPIVLPTKSHTLDFSNHADIEGLDISSLMDAMDDDLNGLELGYPEWIS